jgi:nucleoside-triphosphatase
MSALKILLTGRPGTGKTTVVERTLALLNWPGATGFITRELRRGGARQGFEAVSLDGETCVLAHRDLPGPHRVGRYGVDVDAFERVAVASIDPTEHPDASLLVIDEIGKMECFSLRFCEAVRRALESAVPVLGTIAQLGGGFAGDIRSRQDITLVTVTAKSRDGLPSEVADQLAELARRRKRLNHENRC